VPETNKEHNLIKKFIKGDAYSFDEIYELYNKRVYAFSFHNLKNKEDAEGVVQEVFLNLWKDRAKLQELKNLDAWIFTISFNVINKHFRKLARERKHLEKFEETTLTYDSSTITEVEYHDLLEKAEKIVEELPPRQKTIYILSNKEGLSNTEISTKLHITKKTVENYLTSAKAFIKEKLVYERLLTLLFFWFFIK
jgi:RNA polymerase sigma-70 factor (ECF subfamily)